MSKAPPRGRGRARRVAPEILAPDSTSSDEAVTFVPKESSRKSSSSKSSSSGGKTRSGSRGRAVGATRPRGGSRGRVVQSLGIQMGMDAGDSGSFISEPPPLVIETNLTKSSTSEEPMKTHEPFAVRKGKIAPTFKVDLARRPGFGTNAARKFNVSSNFYKCNGAPPKGIFLYRFSSELTQERNDGRPPVLDYEKSMDFFGKFEKVFFEASSSSSSASDSSNSRDYPNRGPPLAYYDGRDLFYSSVDIMKDEETYDVVYDEKRCRSMKGVPFPVSVRKNKCLTDTIDLYTSSPQKQMDPILMAFFEVMLKHSLYRKEYSRVGQSFYMLNKDARPLDCFIPAKDVFAGFHLNMKHVFSGLAIQVKDKCGVFYKSMPLIQLLCDFWQSDGPQERDFWSDQYRFIESNKFVKKLKVRIVSSTASNGKEKIIKDLTEGPASSTHFEDQSGAKRNVADYFSQSQRLNFPHLPCISTFGKNPEYYPLETCFVLPRQAVKGLLDPNAISSLIRVAAKPAPDTFRAIKDNMLTATQAIQSDMDNLNMSVERSMQKTEARVLEAPAMNYGDGSQHPNNGTWYPRAFISPKKVQNWAACIVSRRSNRAAKDAVKRAIDVLYSAGQKLGMEVGYLAYDDMPSEIIPNQLEEFLGFCADNKFELVLIVLDNKNTEEYAQAKFLAERKFPGLLTQCAQMRTIQKINEQSATMILMKINAKLGGQNAECDLSLVNPTGGVLFTKEHPVLVQGLETSIIPGQESLIGMASSYEQNASLYTMQSRLCENVNVVSSFLDMQKEALKTYYKLTRQKPESIIFFRPGTNEHQISTTAAYEITAIREACKQLQESYKPKITYIMATKNHCTRFCSQQKEFQIGKSQNVPAGTVVDRDIVDVQKWDFYLTSSQGIQGTSIPTKYTVCLDENKLTADSAEALCYYLCHGFVRCNRTISLPNCMKYARLAAERGRNHLKGAAYYIRQNFMSKAKKDQILNLKYLVDCNAEAEEDKKEDSEEEKKDKESEEEKKKKKEDQEGGAKAKKEKKKEKRIENRLHKRMFFT